MHIFGTTTLTYAIVLPIVFVQIFAMAFIPSILCQGAKPLHVGKALFCYAMQGIGIALMTFSGLPAVYSVLMGAQLTGNVYLALVLVFAIGGLAFLWYEHKASHIDDASRVVPYTIFFYTIKFLGAAALITGLLVLALSMLLVGAFGSADLWITPLLILFYGILLSACTKWPRLHPASFNMNPMKKPPVPPSQPQKAPVMVAQKAAKPSTNMKQAAAMQARRK